MKKHVFLVVTGYIKKEIYEQAETAIQAYLPLQAPAIESGIHIYPYSDEGIVSHLVTNYPLPEGSDIGFILVEASERNYEAYEAGVQEAGIVLFDTPMTTEAEDETPSLTYLGGILGYNEEGTGYFEE